MNDTILVIDGNTMIIPLLPQNEELFFKLVRDSFKQKRKTLKNNLREYDFKKIEQILLKNNLPLDIRAENIPLEIFCEISNNL